MVLLKGGPVAKSITENVRVEIENRESAPKLALLRVGDAPSDISYENSALKRMEKCKIAAERRTLPADVSMEEFIRELDSLNRDPSVHGILLFRPLPKGLDETVIAGMLSPKKDVDCMSPVNMEKIFEGNGTIFPCTPEAVLEILHYYGIEIRGKRAVIVGRSMVVGRPLSMMLLKENATVTICHSGSERLPEICREADILIVAVGRSEMITADYVKEGAAVIDVGINVDNAGNLTGDCDFNSVSEKAGFLTPVPGGVGAVTTSVLAKQVLNAMKETEKAGI